MTVFSMNNIVCLVAAAFIGLDKGGIPGFAAVGMTLVLGINRTGMFRKANLYFIS